MTPKQRLFAEEYLVDHNATRAAIRAGYSVKNAGQQGERLLKNAEIAAFVAKAQSERIERVQITQDYVLQRLQVEAEREGEGSSHSARVAALQHLGKHLAMFTDRTEHAGEVTVAAVKVTFERPDD